MTFVIYGFSRAIPDYAYPTIKRQALTNLRQPARIVENRALFFTLRCSNNHIAGRKSEAPSATSRCVNGEELDNQGNRVNEHRDPTTGRYFVTGARKLNHEGTKDTKKNSRKKKMPIYQNVGTVAYWVFRALRSIPSCLRG